MGLTKSINQQIKPYLFMTFLYSLFMEKVQLPDNDPGEEHE